MLLYALTDFFVAVVGALAVIWIGFGAQSAQERVAAIGLGLFGFAASIGTLKFLFGWQAFLEGPHTLTTAIAGTIGMILITVALLGLLSDRLVTLTAIGIAFAVGCASFALEIAFDNPGITAPWISVFCLVAILGITFQHLRQGEVFLGIRSISICLLLIAMGATTALFSEPSQQFYYFHILAAVWMLMIVFHFASLRDPDPIEFKYS